MIFATLSFPGAGWWWLALGGMAALGGLAWLALAPAGPRSRTLAVGFSLRILAVGILVICLLDPQWNTHRPVRGANVFAVVADNSRSMEIPGSASGMSRGDELIARLSGAESDWLLDLGQTFQVRNYLFDRDLHRVSDFRALDASGDRTNLQLALRKLRERFTGQPLAGVLLFTDGIATDLTGEAIDVAGLPPIYPVVVGEGTVPDIRIEHATVRQTAFDDAPVSVQLSVGAAGFDNQWVEATIHPHSGAGLRAESSLPEPKTVRLGSRGESVPVSFEWRPGGSGIQFYEARVMPMSENAPTEATIVNNSRTFMIDRGREAYRILYVGGRPGWEFKFLNRALLDDHQLEMTSLIRVARREPRFEFKGRAGESSNPMFRGFGRDEEAPRYDQPVLVRLNARDENELRGGFPRTARELYEYDAVIIDGAEAEFFTPAQHTLLRNFVSVRGGGLLLLGGADSLDNGGYQHTTLAPAVPIYLDQRSPTTPQGDLSWQLTREGWLEPWVRIRANEQDERARLDSMPRLRVTHPLHAIRPGATVLATLEDETGAMFPALVSQRFGAGRVAVLAVGDMWRWGLANSSEQADLARFWRQMTRWLVTDVPSKVSLRVDPSPNDPEAVTLGVSARNAEYLPVDLASARLTVSRLPGTRDGREPANEPSFSAVELLLVPSPDGPGQFEAEFQGRDSGAYVAMAEVTTLDGELLGRAQTGWVVDHDAAEFQSIEPNRNLLREIARQTGGEVVPWNRLESFVQRLPARPAPITEPWSYSVWNTGWVFFAVLACFIAEWIWRRLRGLP